MAVDKTLNKSMVSNDDDDDNDFSSSNSNKMQCLSNIVHDIASIGYHLTNIIMTPVPNVYLCEYVRMYIF